MQQITDDMAAAGAAILDPMLGNDGAKPLRPFVFNEGQVYELDYAKLAEVFLPKSSAASDGRG